MRKSAGFMIMTLLLLIVPALANAWTLTVKVAGGNDTNKVSVAYNGTEKVVKSGTVYLYPTGAATISLVAGSAAPASVIVDDFAGALPQAYAATTSGAHSVAVAFNVAPLTGTLSLAQTEGGQIYAQNKNNTWSTTGVSGIILDGVVPVTIAADANHKITGYYSYTNPANKGSRINLSGQVQALLIPASRQIIEPEFQRYARIAASIFAPTDGVVGNAVNCSVAATGNVASLNYAFAVSPDVATKTTTGQNFTFTPENAVVYTVTATITSTVAAENTGVEPTVLTAKVVAASALVNANSQCTSCHTTSFPAAVDARKELIHSTNAANTCQSCHTADRPHSTSGLMGGALQGRTLAFKDVGTTAVSTLATVGAADELNGLATDGANLYVAGTADTIYKVKISSGAVTTVGSQSPIGPYITTNGTNLYATDNANTVRSVVIATGTGGVLKNTGFSLSSITTDDVILYVTDSTTIRSVAVPSGDVATVVGTGQFTALRGVTTDGVNLYVTDANRVCKVVIDTGEVTQIAAGFSGPTGITTDGTNLYVADTGNSVIKKVVIATGATTTIANVAAPRGITTDGANLFVTDASNLVKKLTVIVP